MPHRSRKIITATNVPYVGIGFALMYWVVDSSIDVTFFHTETSFIQSVFMPEAMALWMRCFVLLLFMVFSVYVKRILQKHERLKDKMHETEKRLQFTVQDLNLEMQKEKKPYWNYRILQLPIP